MIRILQRLLLFYLIFPGSVPAEDITDRFSGKGVTVQLVSDVRVIQPGQTFHLGLWLHHDAGYHTYWQNPGLAGVPTKLTPQLPLGFTAGTLMYPPPDKVKMAAIRVHGYERDVLIALPVTAPASLPPGPVVFPVEATWMCCQRTCNPGVAKLSLTLQAGPSTAVDESWEPPFQALQAQQPPPLEGWTTTAHRFEKEIELILQPPAGMKLPEAPQFFSSDNLICSHPLQSWQRDGAGYRVRLTLSDFQPDDQTRLRGLLQSHGSWLPGQNAAYVSLAVPLTPAPP